MEIKYGECHCGCGGKTRLAPQNHKKNGWVKGEPVKWRPNHHQRIPSSVDYIIVETGCWIWQRGKGSHGYGTLYIDGNQLLAHRHYYEKHKGRIPEGLDLDHLCRNRACVNPDHLEAVTRAENLRRGKNTKLTKEDVIAIRASNEPMYNLANKYGVSHHQISVIRLRKSWKNI